MTTRKLLAALMAGCMALTLAMPVRAADYSQWQMQAIHDLAVADDASSICWPHNPTDHLVGGQRLLHFYDVYGLTNDDLGETQIEDKAFGWILDAAKANPVKFCHDLFTSFDAQGSRWLLGIPDPPNQPFPDLRQYHQGSGKGE